MAQTPVSADVLQQLAPVLTSLLSSDNNQRWDLDPWQSSHMLLMTVTTIRAAAEAQLNDNWVAQQPDLLLLGLAQFVANNSEVQVRTTYTR